MEVNKLTDLFTLELQDIYDAEKQIVEALPKIIEVAQNERLREGLINHLGETRGHVDRLEQIGNLLDIDLEGKPCEGIRGLLREGEEIIKLKGESSLRDLGIISGARKIEHYEMVAYGCLIESAKTLEEKEVEKLLKETLNEEEKSDKELQTATKFVRDSDNFKMLVDVP